MWLKNNKWKLIISIILIALLAAAFQSGEINDITNLKTNESGTAITEPQAIANAKPESKNTGSPQPQLDSNVPSADLASPRQASSEAKLNTPAESDTSTEKKALPVQAELQCTISISCASILNNISLCDPDKVELVPSDGWILPKTSVSFEAGESVFGVLQRACRDNDIHLEYADTPVYGSIYIEGIANFYEFDVGNLSGWMYSVNGWFPNYGCSSYQLSDGDIIQFVYTCDRGGDVNGTGAKK